MQFIILIITIFNSHRKNQAMKSLYHQHANSFVYCIIFIALLSVGSCQTKPGEQYGFVAMLGDDTISIENITRQGNTVTSDEVDRFPRVRVRHTEVKLGDDGSIRHLVMNIHTPSEPKDEQDRKVTAVVSGNKVHISKTDKTGTVNRNFETGGGIIVAHVPQMYSLYEICFAAALKHAAALKLPQGTTVDMQQFYIDREFDKFPLGKVHVTPLANGKVDIKHDWLSGTGEATIDPNFNMLGYSGARTTYKVNVKRLDNPPGVKIIADRFEALEAISGNVKQLSVRDTMHANIGNAQFVVDYARPLLRGRTLLGNVIPYDNVWRTGANAATQFATSSPIKIAGMQIPAGKYSLWTVPHKNSVDLIVNKQTGQWGTQYNGALNLGKVKMNNDILPAPLEEFTISIQQKDSIHGILVIEWGLFRWTAMIEVQ